MTRVERTAGARNAGVRLSTHDRSLRRALDSLDLGFDLDDLRRYLAGGGVCAGVRTREKANAEAYLTGVVAAAMMLAVEQDRARHPRDDVP
jgi:hypothetical protein